MPRKYLLSIQMLNLSYIKKITINKINFEILKALTIFRTDRNQNTFAATVSINLVLKFNHPLPPLHLPVVINSERASEQIVYFPYFCEVCVTYTKEIVCHYFY